MSIVLNAKVRNDKGKGASRRLRHNKQIPAIVYGGTKHPPIAIVVDLFTITNMLEDDTIYTSILDLVIEGKKENVIIKDLQQHPYKNIVTHIDFQRIDAKAAITTKIPVNITGGDDNTDVRLGAVINQFITTIEVVCLPKNLPHSVDIDVAKLKLGEHLSLTDIIMPKGVEIVALNHDDIEAYNQTVVAINAARKMADIDEDDETTDKDADEDVTEEDKEEK